MHQKYYDLYFRQLPSNMAKQLFFFFERITGHSDVPLRICQAQLVDNDAIHQTPLTMHYYFSCNRSYSPGLSTANENTAAIVSVEQEPMFTIDDKCPRFVIWPHSLSLNVSCTAIYRCATIASLPFAINEAIKWANCYKNIPPQLIVKVSIVVFDLDRTLVYCEELPKQGPLPGHLTVLQYARLHFDMVVLWSHGGTLHVHEQLQNIDFVFDLVLCLNEHESPAPKNLLAIYNHLPPNIRFYYAVLIDDSAYNWSREYDSMIIPSRMLKSLENLIRAVDNVKQDLLQIKKRNTSILTTVAI